MKLIINLFKNARKNAMTFDINRAMYDSSKSDSSKKNSDYQKIFNDDAPTIGYISSKGPCEFILVPPHSMYGAAQTMTSGFFREDGIRGTVPTLGQYGLDWAYVYRKVGSGDPKTRKDILAINMVEGDDGMVIKAEGEWGRGYKSPMYKLYEYLWKTGGGHKYDKMARRSVPTLPVDFNSPQTKRALELAPINNDLGAPISRAVRTLFLQGFVVKTGGTSYTVDEEGQPCWPKHKILMINQVSAIKSREDAKDKEGFYDSFFERTDGVPMSQEAIVRAYGDVSNDFEAQIAWEAGFLHSDFAVQQKLITFKSYSSGPAGIAAYSCKTSNLSDVYGADYSLPDEILQKVKPFSEYILLNTEDLQKQWLQELFVGDEWALIGAGIIEDNSVRIAVPEMPPVTTPAVVPIPTAAVIKTPPIVTNVPAAMPKPAMPAPATPGPKLAMPKPAAAKPAVPPTSLSDQMMAMMTKMKNLKGENN
jgi:hypothetical protein